MGCLAKLRKPFMKGRPHGWGHAIAVVHMERDGSFIVEVVEIQRGRAWVWGKEVRA